MLGAPNSFRLNDFHGRAGFLVNASPRIWVMFEQVAHLQQVTEHFSEAARRSVNNSSAVRRLGDDRFAFFGGSISPFHTVLTLVSDWIAERVSCTFEVTTMKLPISTWALIAGLGAAGTTLVLLRVTTLPSQVPTAVLWLGRELPAGSP